MRVLFVLACRYPYITIIQNFSQMWALYCLVQFYHVTRDTLQEINPLAKFLCFKAVVFVTWWQGVLIALLFASGIARKWLPGHPSEAQTDMLQTNLQDFIICIEVSSTVHFLLFKTSIWFLCGLHIHLIPSGIVSYKNLN